MTPVSTIGNKAAQIAPRSPGSQYVKSPMLVNALQGKPALIFITCAPLFTAERIAPPILNAYVSTPDTLISIGTTTWPPVPAVPKPSFNCAPIRATTPLPCHERPPNKLFPTVGIPCAAPGEHLTLVASATHSLIVDAFRKSWLVLKPISMIAT